MVNIFHLLVVAFADWFSNTAEDFRSGIQDPAFEPPPNFSTPSTMENAGYDFGYQQPPVPDPYHLQDPCTSVLYTLSKQTEQTPFSLPICRPGRGFYSCNEWSGSACVFN